jgi:hypothetical protein
MLRCRGRGKGMCVGGVGVGVEAAGLDAVATGAQAAQCRWQGVRTVWTAVGDLRQQEGCASEGVLSCSDVGLLVYRWAGVLGVCADVSTCAGRGLLQPATSFGQQECTAVGPDDQVETVCRSRPEASRGLCSWLCMVQHGSGGAQGWLGAAAHLICSLMAASHSGWKLTRAKDSFSESVLVTVASSPLTCSSTFEREMRCCAGLTDAA